MTTKNRGSIVVFASSSSSSSDNGEDFQEEAVTHSKGRGMAKKYYFQQEYPSFELAKKALAEEEMWCWKSKLFENS
jgi:hypothetical protein